MNARRNLTIIALVMTIAASVACGIGGSGSTPGDIEGFVLEDASYMITMNVNGLLNAVDVPFSDVAAAGFLSLSSDAEDFEDALDELRDDWDDDDASLGTTLDEVADVMVVESGGFFYTAVQGDFDFAYIRSELEDQDFEEKTYRDREIWEKNDFEAVAIFDASNVFVSGSKDSVREVIKAAQRGEGFADSETNGLIGVRDKTGKGLVFLGSSDCTNFFRIYLGALKNCEAFGLAITGGTEEEVEMSLSVMFSSERRAETGRDDLEDSIEDDNDIDADINEITVDGQFVTSKLTIYE